MAKLLHVFDFLDSEPDLASIPICALYGNERFLKTLAIRRMVEATKKAGQGSDDEEADEEEFGIGRFDGKEVDWADVMDELCTNSLFGGGGPKLVIIDHADDFVKAYRDKLEDFVAKPRGNGTLVLVVGTWAKNTRLYKAIDKGGLQVKCEAPAKSGGNRADIAKIAKWVVTRAKKVHQFKISGTGADMVVELTDADFGRIEQELCKLALFADDPKKEIKPDKVAEVVGGWRTRTMWNAIDAVMDGNSGTALKLLDQLIKSGEHPLALFGQLSWSLRRYGGLVDLVDRQKRAGGRYRLGEALKQAGFKSWGGELASAEQRLKRLGRRRASQLNRKLLEADLALKRTHSTRGRIVLEELFVWLSADKEELGA